MKYNTSDVCGYISYRHYNILQVVSLDTSKSLSKYIKDIGGLIILQKLFFLDPM